MENQHRDLVQVWASTWLYAPRSLAFCFSRRSREHSNFHIPWQKHCCIKSMVLWWCADWWCHCCTWFTCFTTVLEIEAPENSGKIYCVDWDWGRGCHLRSLSRHGFRWLTCSMLYFVSRRASRWQAPQIPVHSDWTVLENCRTCLAQASPCSPTLDISCSS